MGKSQCHTVTIEKRGWIEKYQNYLYHEDLKRLSESHLLQILPHLTLLRGPQKYLQNNISLEYMRVLCQIRLLNKIFIRIRINKKSYKLSVSGVCGGCGVNTPDMCFHLLIECPSLLEERKKYICESQDESIVKTDFINLLENPKKI